MLSSVRTHRTQPGVPPPPPGHDRLWMPIPDNVRDAPPGLEYLKLIDKIQIKQACLSGVLKKELAEVVLNWETKNRYVISNGTGQQVYYAYEESGCCTRQCCESQRGFVIHVVDNYEKEVMRISRPFKCCSCCCWCALPGWCCSHEVVVEAPPGNVIGTVQQRIASCSNSYIVLDDDGKEILDLEGPFCCLMCGCQDKVYPIKTVQGQEIGEIRKEWSGILKESFTDADNFGVSFPMDMAIRTKATMIGATFLIDFMNFENSSMHDFSTFYLLK